MERDRLSRKLAVILHADVVGSTLLVQKNESLAHQRIQAAFNRFSETIAAYGGKAHEIRGDALVAEFNRASDAVPAALAFQSLNEELNSAINDDIQPQLRIGISLGEVVVADNTLTGAGVVLAQRLEQLAESGGVVVQGSVSETVPTRMPFDFESLGEQMLKGFDQPVRAFSARLRPGKELPSPEFIAAPQSVESEKLQIPDKPSIAVLPFTNLSGDAEQDYFVDGMTDEIITGLSRVPDLFVVANNSTMVYKGRAVNIKEVGREQGVRYVLEGSIRKAGNQIRVSAQLIDAISGLHVWADRYQRELNDIFAVQDEITQKVVVELQVKLVTGEHSRLWATGTSNVEAWELAMRSRPLVASLVRDDGMAGRQLLGRALELDNNYPGAWTMLGWTYFHESVWKWVPDTEKSMQKAFEAAQKALSADAQYPDGYSLLGTIYMVRGDTNQAIAMNEKAVELAPNDSQVLAFLGNVLIDSGRVREGIQKMQRAIRLCPFPPAWYLMVLGVGFHLNGDNEAAISALEQAAEREPDSVLSRLWLASALVEMGRLDDAREVSKTGIDIEPAFDVMSWANSFSSKSHLRLKGNLLAAGFLE
jgi:adenylate cyclase